MAEPESPDTHLLRDVVIGATLALAGWAWLVGRKDPERLVFPASWVTDAAKRKTGQ